MEYNLKRALKLVGGIASADERTTEVFLPFFLICMTYLFSLAGDTCADCHSLATTSYPTQGQQILTSSGCQCSSGLVGDGSSCSGNVQHSIPYLIIRLFSNY